MHLIFVADGLPEGIKTLERNLDKMSLGKGVMRLREIKMYDLQFPKEVLPQVTAEFYRDSIDKITKDGLSYSFKYKKNPFKHGLVMFGINLAVTLFGRWFGLRPLNKKLGEGIKPVIPKPLTNIYPIAICNDNEMNNKQLNRVEEWL